MHAEITPLDLTRKTFLTRWRGFDRVEVETYLREVSDELERALQRNGELERRIIELEGENRQHREREELLRDTLMNAQKTAEDVRASARREADLVVREAEALSERITERAQERASEIERAVQELRVERRRLHTKLAHALELFHQSLEMDREQEAADGAVVTFLPAARAEERA